MGYPGDDRSGGGDRWQRRDQYRGPEQGRGGYRGGGSRDEDDRGFLDRAGDEVRSWFGDDEAQRRREMDQRRWEQEQRMTGRRDNDYGEGGGGPSSFGGGWGNQRGASWSRERPGERGWYGADDERGGGGGERHYARGEREGWFSDSRGGERGERYGGSGGGGNAGSYGASPHGSGRDSRYAAMRDRGGDRGGGGGSEGFGGDRLRGEGGGYGGLHDPHYSEWRQRQIEDLDRDYDEYRREHQSKFEQEFGAWRSKRQTQRQSLNRVTEHMEVVGSDGGHVGTVDVVRGERIVLTRSDPSAGGLHHSVPCSWVESIDDKVTLNRSADEARSEWRNEARNPALFGEEARGGAESADEGPRNLNRSFSGTYQQDGEGGEGRNR